MDDLKNGNAENRPYDRRAVQSLRRIMLEIVIGFIGVYAAFALAAYKERRDVVDRRHQIKRALIAEIHDMAVLSKSNAPFYYETLAQFDSAVAAGKKPIPRPFFEAIGLNNHAWEATKAAGLNIIDPPTFFRLSEYYNRWSNMLAQYTQLREISMTVIFPGMDRGPDAFYDPKTAKPHAIFTVYRRDLKRLGDMSKTLSIWGDSLVGVLARDTL